MINANELRRGNWVKWDNADMFYQIESINENTGSEEDPIPLTSEILKKAGFMWSIYHQAFHKEGFPFDVNEGNEWFTLYTFKKSTHITSCLKYLHQLQNLFFALTGEELPIEL